MLSLEQNFEGQCFPMLTKKSRVLSSQSPPYCRLHCYVSPLNARTKKEAVDEKKKNIYIYIYHMKKKKISQIKDKKKITDKKVSVKTIVTDEKQN